MSRLAVLLLEADLTFNLVNAVEEKRLDAEISLLVCDKPEARAVGRANYHHIPCFAFSAKAYESKEAFEKKY